MHRKVSRNRRSFQCHESRSICIRYIRCNFGIYVCRRVNARHDFAMVNVHAFDKGFLVDEARINRNGTRSEFSRIVIHTGNPNHARAPAGHNPGPVVVDPNSNIGHARVSARSIVVLSKAVIVDVECFHPKTKLDIWIDGVAS